MKVTVGRNLLHDWESRGFLDGIKQVCPDFQYEYHHTRSWVDAPRNIIRLLVDDAEYQIGSWMNTDASTARTNRKFIENANKEMNNETL